MIQVTNQIILLPLAMEHAPLLFHIIDTERPYLREWLPFIDNSKEVTDTEKFIQSVLPSDNKQFAIQYKGKIVGIIAFRDTEMSNMRTEIGYWISQYAQGNGIVTQSVKSLLSYAFAELGINRVQLRVAVNNIKSRNIPERLSFSYEGTEREGEISSFGGFNDIAVYSILKNEFKA